MSELVVPEVVDDQFKEHYQELIRSSLLRSVQAEERIGRARRRRVERTAALLSAPPAAVEPESPAPAPEAPPWPAVAPAPAPVMPVLERTHVPIRPRLRLAVKVLWVAAVVLLVCDAFAFGLYSWATGSADVAVLVLSVVWFLVSTDRGFPVVAAAPATPVVEAPLAEEPVADERIDGLRVTRLQMERDAGGHVTELEHLAGFPAWRAVSCRAGTLRGMHAHVHADDLRIVVEGKVALWLKDLRPGSPSEGRSELLELSADEYTAIVIPPGVAHGLFARSDALVLVAVTPAEDDELGCAWNDPGLGISWPGEPQFLSERDRRAGPLATLAQELAARLPRAT